MQISLSDVNVYAKYVENARVIEWINVDVERIDRIDLHVRALNILI